MNLTYLICNKLHFVYAPFLIMSALFCFTLCTIVVSMDCLNHFFHSIHWPHPFWEMLCWTPITKPTIHFVHLQLAVCETCMFFLVVLVAWEYNISTVELVSNVKFESCNVLFLPTVYLLVYNFTMIIISHQIVFLCSPIQWVTTVTEVHD